MMYKITKKLFFRKPIPDLKRFLLVLSIGLFLGAFQNLYAQRTVTGKVTDETGSGVPGVAVVVKNTQTGSVTDADGNYSISVPGDDAILVFTSVGYATQEITVGAQSVVDVQIALSVTEIGELIVTGYTIDDRRETTGAVSTVKAKDLTVVPSGNVEQQLQGRVAGVTVITNGQPGTTSQIRVRGFGGFGDNRPLYIVDGVPTYDVSFINPDDIENVTVLKDAAAASIYGARAASGVIVYTTKKGKKDGKIHVTYDGMVGFTDPGKGRSTLNPTDFATWTWNAFKNTAFENGTQPVFSHPQFGTGSTPVIPDYLLVGDQTGVVGNVDINALKSQYNVSDFTKPIFQVVKANKEGTDWYKAITRNAAITRHSIGISGGNENARYFVGFSGQEQDGIQIHQRFRRYTFRVNTDFNVTKKLKIGEKLQFTYRENRLLSGANGGQGSSSEENNILAAFRMPSIIPVYDVFGGYAGTRAKGFNNPRNPVADLDRHKNDRGYTASGFGNVYLEYAPIEGLTIRSSIGGNYNNFYYFNYTPRQYENSENNGAFTYGEGGGYDFGWIFSNTVNYKKKFGAHDIDVLVGQEALNAGGGTGTGRNINASGLDPFAQDGDFVNLTTTTPGATRVVNSNYFKGITFASYFGRLNYSFNDKYLVSFVVRRDGSSRFGAANRYGIFPAFSAAWRLSSEGFMSSVSWINDLKIRGGYGAMANSNNVDPYNQYSLYGTSVGNSSYDITGSNALAQTGFYRSRIGNSNAKWETAITTNIGFDGVFLNNKLDVIVDFWRKDSKDLLLQVPISAENGVYASAPAVNAGKMRNQGIDVQLGTNFKVKDFKIDVTVNGGFLQNKVLAFANGQDYLASVNPSFRGINPIRNQLGYSISSFYGYQVVGLFKDQAAVDAAPTQDGAGPGRFQFKDLNGDGKIDVNDRTYLGSPVPKFQGGLTLKVTYKNFELVTYSSLTAGNKIWNQSKWFTDFYPSFAGAAIGTRVLNSWTPTNTNTDTPIFENTSNFSTNTQACSFYVESGTYFRMQNITLAYNLPDNILKKLGMSRLRVYASTNNVFTITKYKGLDPSVGGSADTNFGIDVGNYPITRSYTFGLNLAF